MSVNYGYDTIVLMKKNGNRYCKKCGFKLNHNGTRRLKSGKISGK
jgi:hypothetical protein